MADLQPIPPESEPQSEIRELLVEIRRQNVMLNRYLCLIGGGLTLLVLMQSGLITQIFNYAVIVVLVMVVMLTAPWWSQLIGKLTERLPWSSKDKKKS